METNESILTRNVVGIDDRKVLGKVKELRVNCDTLAVSDYLVSSPSTGSLLVLPFDRAMATGDTFMTIQSRDEFLPGADMESREIVENGFKLIDVEVYSRVGNRLGTVASYEYDPVFGTVTSITLDSGLVYPYDTFVFFQPEFVFVDDGGMTAAELRAKADSNTAEADARNAAAQAEANEAAVAIFSNAEETDEVAAEIDAVEAIEAEEAEEAVAEEIVEAIEDEADEEVNDAEDAMLAEYLIGSTTVEDVSSEDDMFTIVKGTTLTADLVEEARKHGMLLSLTMSVDM